MKKSGCLIAFAYATIAVLTALLPPDAVAQGGSAYPSKPVTVIIPFAPGAVTDTEARLYTQKLHESTGQPFIFDYKPGAGTSIGLAYVAKAAPDGYTLLITNSGLAIHPHFHQSLPYDVLKNFAPITILSSRTTGLWTNPAALPNVYSINDLVAYAKSNPAALSCTTAGLGSITHLICAALASETRINIVPVHYKGTAQGQADLLAGRAQLQAGGTVFSFLPLLKSGKLRLIAVLGDERSKILPDAKTSAEQGVNLNFPSWLGMLAPAGTPPAAIRRLHSESVKAVRSPDIVKQLEDGGSTPVGSTPEVFRERIAKEFAQWKKVIQENNIKGEL